jgi:transposase
LLRESIVQTGLLTERLRVRVREIDDDDEGRRLVRIVRRGSGSVVTWRRAQMVLLSAQAMDVAAIAKVAFTSEDRVRDVIRNFNADGFGSLYPKYKGGRPPKFSLPQRWGIRKIAKSKPAEHGLPFSAWSLSKLAEFLVAEGVVDDISHEGLRTLLREEGVSFQRIKTWKASADPHYAARKARIEHLYAIADGEVVPDPGEPEVIFCVDEFGPLNLQLRPRRENPHGSDALPARRLSDAVYRQLAADALGPEQASPGGHPGASLISSAAGLSPDTGTSDQPLPGPAPQTLPPSPETPKAMAPAAAATRRRARGVTWSAYSGGQGRCSPREAPRRADRQSSRDDNLVGVRPPGPSSGDAVSIKSSKDKHPKRSPGETLTRKVEVSAPCRTNDVDTDQRRHTLNSAGVMPLTDPFIEGSQKRAFLPSRGLGCSKPARVPSGPLALHDRGRRVGAR